MLHSFASEDLECSAAVIWTVCFMHFCYSFGSLSALAQKRAVQTFCTNLLLCSKEGREREREGEKERKRENERERERERE